VSEGLPKHLGKGEIAKIKKITGGQEGNNCTAEEQ